MSQSNRNLFVTPPVLPAVGRSSTANISSLGRVSEIRDVGPNVTKQQQSRGKSTMLNSVKEVVDMIPEGVKADIVKGISDGVIRIVKPGGNSARHSSGYGLSAAPDPLPIRLDSGIKPNTYVSDYLTPVEGKCCPLHMTGVKIQFPTYSASALNDFFLKTVAFHVQSNAQKNVSFNLDLTIFSATNIQTAMNDLVYALQIYYYYASILTYFSDPANNNAGMIYLRQNITATMINDLLLLKRRLLDTPCPPNLFEFVRYLSGTFSSGDGAGAPLIKLYPIAPSDTLIDGAVINTALNNISTGTTANVFTLMRKAVPHWTPSSLPDVPVEPLYDENFKTIFANCPASAFYNTIGNYIPTVATDDTVIQYNSYTNALDGLAFACTASYNATSLNWIPGLIVPTAAASSLALNTRRSYYTVSGVTKFWQSDNYPFLTRSRQETYNVSDACAGSSTIYTPHLYGTESCAQVTANTIKETTFKCIDYLMSLEVIKVDAKNYHFKNSRSGKSSK